MPRRAFRIIADRLINQTAFQKQFLSESFSQHLRLLNLRELHARFSGGLSNPSGFAGERFSEGKGRISPIAFQPHPTSERRSYPCAVGRICPRRGIDRRYTISKMLPLVLAAALAAWLRTRRMWRLPFGDRWL